MEKGPHQPFLICRMWSCVDILFRKALSCMSIFIFLIPILPYGEILKDFDQNDGTKAKSIDIPFLLLHFLLVQGCIFNFNIGFGLQSSDQIYSTRNCLGQKFGLQEMTIVLSMIMQRFHTVELNFVFHFLIFHSGLM